MILGHLLPAFLLNHKLNSLKMFKYLPVWRPTGQNEKKKLKLLPERHWSRFIMTYTTMTFSKQMSDTVCLLNVTELFWTRIEAQICAGCPERLRAMQPFLSSICCCMYSYTRRAVAQLHSFPIHALAASRLDICKENSKHVDLKHYFIHYALNINSIKSIVFTANLRQSNDVTAVTQILEGIG